MNRPTAISAGADRIPFKGIGGRSEADLLTPNSFNHYKELSLTNRLNFSCELKTPAASCRESSTVRKFIIFRFAR